MSSDHEPLSTLTFIGSDRPVARRVARPVLRFLSIEAAGGALLIAATLVALIWVNSPLSDSYHDFWETKVTIEVGDILAIEGHGDHGGEEGYGGEESAGGETAAVAGDSTEEGAEAEEESHGISLHDLVNDALMAIFFFVVGLEIKRELVVGELRNPRDALLPAVAALGGMIVPALLFFALNPTGDAAAGWGIPMATDIAFAVGVLSLLGSRVPSKLKIFLLTLAIVDDIGAIIVIAIFYSSGISFGWLATAAVLIGVVALMKRSRIWYVPAYVFVGVFVWLAVFQSGVHATIAGVILGLMAPARPLAPDVPDEALSPLRTEGATLPAQARRATFYAKESISVAERLEDVLHPFSSFLIIPIFALANAGIELSSETLRAASTASITIGVILGLVVGKTVGVTIFTLAADAFGIAKIPAGINRMQIAGIGAISGIGFTVSIFVTGLAYDSILFQDEAKIGILVASIVAALLGAGLLRASAGKTVTGEDDFGDTGEFSEAAVAN